MSATSHIRDWTHGTAGIALQACGACGARWAFRRHFCPECGTAGPKTLQASGRGVVHAVTTVSRAPTEAFRALAPYHIVLVDLEEGVRIMAHGADGLAIGDPVVASFVSAGPTLMPRFEPAALGAHQEA